MLKKTLFCFIFIFSLIGAGICHAAEPSLISESAVLIDAETGQVLYSKAMHEKRYPASITKIATVITGLEHASLDDKIVMSDEAVSSVSRDSSHIALDFGEELTLEQAAHAALMMSANDACNGIAELCAGSIDEFVVMMNEMATKSGALGTHFANANGLRDENHYTTAYDMAMICRYAIKNESFLEIFGKYKYTMAPTNKQPEERPFVNQHDMLNYNFNYEGVIGGKAGWTTDAQYTLVTAAQRNGIRLIAVVMKSPRNNDKYTDTAALFDYGFSEYEQLEITNELLPDGYTLANSVKILVPVGTTADKLNFEILENDDKSLVSITLADGAGELVSLPCKKESAPANASEDSTEENAEIKGISFWGILLIILLTPIALFILLIIFIIIRKKVYKIIRRRRRRRRQMQQRRNYNRDYNNYRNYRRR